VDDDLGTSGSEGSPSGDSGIIYEIDADAPASSDPTTDQGSARAQAAAPAPAPAAPAQEPWRAELDGLRRQNAELAAELTPFLAHLQQQVRGANAPPFSDPAELDTNPNLKPSDLYRALLAANQDQLQRLGAQQQFIARATLSEQTARGAFSAAEMGEGNDYDTLVARYVAPLVQANPAVDNLIAAAGPNDPATVRMIFATVCLAIDEAKGDVVKGIKSFLGGFRAVAQAGEDTRKSIQRAARAQSARVQPAGPAAGGPQRRKLTDTDVWNLPEKEFERFINQGI